MQFHTALFLFNYKKRTLHGVFEATERGSLNIDPTAWTAAGDSINARGTHFRGPSGGGSSFPAQVRFQVVHEFPPLPEACFSHIVTYKQGGKREFDFQLSSEQVTQLMGAFLARAAEVDARES